MIIEQIYTGCLAQGAYYIQSGSEAVIIDPIREVDGYIKKAKENGATIKYIFESHFHADFVSGHLDLAKKTGAKIVFGPTAKTDFDCHVATDGEVFQVGEVQLKLLHTPGHTMESSTLLLLDETGKEHAIFTGDTLFIGDVGRPDLAVKSELTKEDLAGYLFDSLRNKIMTLSDEVTVYPGHGAGSACGKNLSSERHDSLGNQKKNNYALATDLSREDFIAELTANIMPPPQYFPANVKMNKSGYESIDTVMETGNVPLTIESFEALANHEGALVLDTRNQADFMKAHIPNSIFIGIDGSFAPWVGALITDLKQPIVFVADEGREEEVVIRLSRVGYDNTLGFLAGGMTTWTEAGKEVADMETITPEEFETRFSKGLNHVLDVRKPGEFEAAHVENAVTFPLDYINDQMDSIDPDGHYHIYCAGGYRSVIAASILKSRGIHGLVNVEQGFKGISNTKINTTDFVCPSTLK